MCQYEKLQGGIGLLLLQILYLIIFLHNDYNSCLILSWHLMVVGDVHVGIFIANDA